ncbi:MAG: PAS domain S-box protein [Chloroflexi bacterium]|nr:PAS domain S-box protein [Chloroflexota bacterium]
MGVSIGGTILAIDDDPDTLVWLQHLFESEGFQIFSATTGEALVLGVDDFLSKPAAPHELLFRVRTLLLARERLRQARADQQAIEERYRLLSELTSDYAFSYRIEPDGMPVMEWITGAFTRITGYTEGDIAAMAPAEWRRLVHPDDLSHIVESHAVCLPGQMDVGEFRILTKSGGLRWFCCYNRPVWDPSAGRVVRVLGAIQDITERKQIEDDLRASEQRFHNLFDEAPVGYHELDRDGRITRVNRTELELLGYDEAEMLGRPYWEFSAAYLSVFAGLPFDHGSVSPPIDPPPAAADRDRVLPARTSN